MNEGAQMITRSGSQLEKVTDEQHHTSASA
jgi:hypothetical protein